MLKVLPSLCFVVAVNIDPPALAQLQLHMLGKYMVMRDDGYMGHHNTNANTSALYYF